MKIKKEKKIIIVPSKKLDIKIVRSMNTLLKIIEENPDIEIWRLHLKVGKEVLTEYLTGREAKEKIKEIGIDLTIC